MSDDALGVASNPSSTRHDDEVLGEKAAAATGVGPPIALAETVPVTPKSFHSTRSSFKKNQSPPPPPLPSSQPPIGYDYTSLSLNSSRSSLHRPSTSPANNNNDPSAACVMIASIGLTDVVVGLPDTDIISYSDPGVLVKEPIVIRGAGNLTIFGVCNKFSEQFPSALNAKLAPEEFRDTLGQINSILNKELENSFKWLVVGSLFCCCTLGCSLLPVIYLNKKAKLCINKLLDIENQRLYNKLGLRWRLAKLKCNSNSLFEYVLLIEFLPVMSLYQPD